MRYLLLYSVSFFLLLISVCCNPSTNSNSVRDIDTAVKSYKESSGLDIHSPDLFAQDEVVPMDTGSKAINSGDTILSDRKRENAPTGASYGRLIFDAPVRPIILEKAPNRDQGVRVAVLSLPLKVASLKDTIRIRLYNYTSDTLKTGLSYRIEFLERNGWKTVSPPQGYGFFEDIGYSLLPYHGSDFLIRMFPHIHRYRPGRYRIIKDYFVDDYRNNQEISAEFLIE
ncbi:immunoglobulin-like domain-containing protein [Sphingobacterium hotanense]|uniref:immunoglobulin-like domain-containing protein n=1 Tax=Sphingobacterium TaxID=28453 RepID=UPI0021A3AC0F|nr:immunoglobulin-like domain-containing protein [Sphingobacterium hotanense]MCT1523660.1 hypothetical protein [Sphingobacterium hotanense]